MKLAIVGSSGYIAGFLLKQIKADPYIDSVLLIDKSNDTDAYLDLTDSENFEYSLLNDIDCIIYTAAISGPDLCATDFEDCWTVNVTGTIKFIQNAIARNCNVLFFSSDAVFGDMPGKIYDELSPTKADTSYGKMKKAVEDHFWSDPHFKAIRLSYVVSERDRFTSYCLDCVRRHQVAEVFHPFYRNCVSVTDVVDTVMWLAKNWSCYAPQYLNVAGKELVSRVRIADELNRCIGGKLQYAVSFPKNDFFRNRPQITQMKSLYMQQYGILQDNTFTEKYQKELEEILL